jgi:hypothetical protein
MSNNNEDILSKLKSRRSKLEEELGQQIAKTTIDIIEWRTPKANTFPP